MPESLSVAISVAAMWHQGQTRKDSTLPYIVHPIAVASNVRQFVQAFGSPEENKNLEMLMKGAVLHDVVEDCPGVTFDKIKSLFGSQVASLVEELTNDPAMVEEMGKTEYLKCKMHGMTSDALLIKLCDRLDNLRDYVYAGLSPKGKAYVESTKRILVYLEKEKVLSCCQLAIIEEIKKYLY